MKTADITLVIPVFNAKAYLEDLIRSLRAQTILPEQIIFVDDGSTDGSGELIKELTIDICGVEIIRQDNQGQAVARNVGLKYAKGKYISFVDADDFLEPEFYETLYQLSEQENLEISMVNARNHHEGRRDDTLVYKTIQDTGVISGEQWFVSRWEEKYMPHYCWMNLYRTDFVKDNGFTFPRADPHEDVVWVTETLLAAKRFHYVPKPLYWYRKKKPNPSAQAPDIPVLRSKHIDSGFYNTRALAQISQRSTIGEVARSILVNDFVNGGCNLIRQVLRLENRQQRAFYLKQIDEQEIFSLILKHAQSYKHYLRIARYKLISIFSK